MRKFVVVFASVVLLGAMSAGPAAWADHGEDDLTVFAKVTDVEKEDHGDEGPSEGDKLSLEADLFDEDWEDAGTSEAECVVTKFEGEAHDHEMKAAHAGEDHGGEKPAHPDFAADCESGFDLEDGEIEAAGEITDEDFEDGSITLAITGGEGDFDDAEGEVVIEPLEEEEHAHHAASHDDGGHDDGEKDHHGPKAFKVTFHFTG